MSKTVTDNGGPAEACYADESSKVILSSLLKGLDGYLAKYAKSDEAAAGDDVRILIDEIEEFNFKHAQKTYASALRVLDVAFKLGHEDLVKSLLSVYTDQEGSINGLLFAAISLGKLEDVRGLIAKGAIVDKGIEAIASMLFLAASQQDEGGAFLELLKHDEVAKGVGLRDTLEKSLLIYIANESGAEDGSIEMTNRLLEFSSVVKDIDHQDHLGQTALSFAVEAVNPEVVKKLLGAGANPSISCVVGKELKIPFVEAYKSMLLSRDLDCVERAKRMVKMLKGRVDERDKEGKTPLILAATHGDLDAVECLLDRAGADLNLTDLKGVHPIEHAALNNHEDVVDNLAIREDIRISHAKLCGLIGMIKVMGFKGVNETLESMNEKKQSSFLEISKTDDLKAGHLLDVGISDKNKKDALMIRLIAGDVEFLEELIKSKGFALTPEDDFHEILESRRAFALTLEEKDSIDGLEDLDPKVPSLACEFLPERLSELMEKQMFFGPGALAEAKYQSIFEHLIAPEDESEGGGKKAKKSNAKKKKKGKKAGKGKGGGKKPGKGKDAFVVDDDTRELLIRYLDLKAYIESYPDFAEYIRGEKKIINPVSGAQESFPDKVLPPILLRMSTRDVTSFLKSNPEKAALLLISDLTDTLSEEGGAPSRKDIFSYDRTEILKTLLARSDFPDIFSLILECLSHSPHEIKKIKPAIAELKDLVARDKSEYLGLFSTKSEEIIEELQKAEDKRLATELMNAIALNDVEKCGSLLEEGANPMYVISDDQDRERFIPLCKGVGVDPDIVDTIGITPLMAAHNSANKDILPLFVNESYLNRQSLDGYSAITLVVVLGDLELLKGISKFDSFNIKDQAPDPGGETLLSHAAFLGNKEMCKWLLDEGFEMFSLSGEGCTALTAMSRGDAKERLAAVRLLLDLGFKTTDPDSHGSFALEHAILDGFTNMVNLLVEASSEEEIAHICENGRIINPLLFAAATGDVDKCRELIDGADGDSDAKKGRALIVASANGQLEVARFLLDEKHVAPSGVCTGKSLSSKGCFTWGSPLKFAMSSLCFPMLDLLFERGATLSPDDRSDIDDMKQRDPERYDKLLRHPKIKCELEDGLVRNFVEKVAAETTGPLTVKEYASLAGRGKNEGGRAAGNSM